MDRVTSASDCQRSIEQRGCRCGRRVVASHPSLVEQGGTLVVRYAGCAQCHDPAAYDFAFPEDIDALARGALAAAPAGETRTHDPGVITALAPFVARAFPAYASKEEATWAVNFTMADAIATSPGWRIVQWLRGASDYGQARMQHDDGTRAIGTYTRPQQHADTLLRRLHHTAPGVAPLVGVRSLGGKALLLEGEPPGVPLSTPMFPLPLDTALGLFQQLLAIVAGAEQRRELLHGVRPELVYIDRVADALAVSGVVPRAERFALGASPDGGEFAPQLPFDALYSAPEVIGAQRSGAPADVFSACAVFLFMIARKSPFGPAGQLMPQLAAIMGGKPELPAELPSPIAAAIRAGLAVDPDRRPRAAELARALG